MRNVKYQTGASLIIALVVLLITTMIGISAVRLSTQDLMIASNEQQKMMVAQASESARNKVVNFFNVYKWIEDETLPSIQTRQLDSGSVKSEVTIARGAKYICFGQSGEAMSIGPGATQCRVYTFDINSTLVGTGARDRLFKGEGKELPSMAGDGLNSN